MNQTLCVVWVFLNGDDAGLLTWELIQLHDPKFKNYEDFTMDNWRDLVEKALLSSQLRKTCDKFAENTIEEARRRRISRFTGEIEPILQSLVSSLE